MQTERKHHQIALKSVDPVKEQLLHWMAGQGEGMYLDSHTQAGADWECLAAVGIKAAIQRPAGSAFEALQQFLDEHPDWLFGYLGYDLKNEVEKLHSSHFDGVNFPDLYFFQPMVVAGIRNEVLEVFSTGETTPEAVIEAILAQKIPDYSEKRPESPMVIHPRLAKEDYLQTIEKIRRHIIEGDVYELNFCQEFYANSVEIEPLQVFKRLRSIGQAPFSAFLKMGDQYMLCGSPERFLKKSGDLLVSQPIKGTRKRGASFEEDTAIKVELQQSEKDRAENVMIVDLVRNDLAKNCVPGSVETTELFGIHTFNTVHQMISTVKGSMRAGIHAVDVLKNAFPMGSMTGAPKVMAMELIEQYEHSRRGLFSGAAGFFTPDADFDFNVVIRTILYHAGQQYLSFQTGGAIVYDSIPEQEYDECMVKASLMLRALDAQMAP